MNLEKKKFFNKTAFLALLLIVVLSSSGFSADRLGHTDKTADLQKKTERIRTQLIKLPRYGAFDLIDFEVEGTKVILNGFVTIPTLKRDAERTLLRLEEIDQVDNRIEVLPLSNSDDSIRYQAYNAIYRHPSLNRYAPGGGMTATDSRRFRSETYFGLQSALQPKGPHPIHIIVKHGHVELVGIVSKDSEKSIAEIIVNGLSGVFSVTNHIRVS